MSQPQEPSVAAPCVVDEQDLIEKFKEAVAANLGLKCSDVFGLGQSLAEVLARSPSATNSIDLVEAFAAAIAKYELDGLIDIPASTMEVGIDKLIADIREQIRHITE